MAFGPFLMSTRTLCGAGFVPLVAPFAALAVTTEHALLEVANLGVGCYQLCAQLHLSLGGFFIGVVQQHPVAVLVPTASLDGTRVELLEMVGH